jgi:thiamine-phosphate pyrophosphorylase
MEAPDRQNVTRAQRAAQLHGIYVIVNEAPGALAIARAALAAGVKIVQYRAKGGIDSLHLEQLREATRMHDALLIMNDDWRAALAFDCDGVHLGPGDDGFAAVAPVRAALGERLIGLSCGTLAEAQAANDEDLDYIGVGAVYATASKADAGQPIGIVGLRRVAAASRFPAAAIGGIGLPEIAAVRASGVAMAAVISAVATAEDPGAASRALVGAWRGA